MYTSSVRALRAGLATVVRRAEAGESTVITVHGRPVAAIVPRASTSDTDITLDRLVASGAVVPARRRDRWRPGDAVRVWTGTRIDQALREIRGMSLFLDTSALLGAVIDTPSRSVVLSALDDEPDAGYASALALTEALAAIDRLIDEEVLRVDLEDAVRRLWDHLHVVPVDQACLDEAARLARQRPVRLADALHFAAARRLPTPVAFATLDPAQVEVAHGIHLRVITP